MSGPDNTDRVRAGLDQVSRGNVNGLLELLADNVTYQLIGGAAHSRLG